MKANVSKAVDKYYISIIGKTAFFHDHLIAQYLKMSNKDYQKYALENCNAFLYDNEVYFKSLDNAQLFADWITSVMIYNSLI